ncbi:MAG: DegT/DnrJ/EryC1/StrS family aminotransferase [Candidatus Thorarchaeota archaeon]|nr:MAG: DegT/DnrJ/EryC1/StrS family aminotransferase [Candidatus Thorarchaeota archaeon]
MIPAAKPIIEEEEIDAVVEVLKSGMLAEGKVARKFESEFRDYVGTKFATVTSNGTTALSTALEALEIQPGDEVITTPFTFIASANTIAMIGAIPVFVDIEPDTYNIDPNLVEKAITEKTKAIMPVHIFGMPADMPRILEIADKHDLFVIEDACQAHGAEISGRMAGSMGHVSAFSFYATKNLMTAEGGMITTDNEELYDKALEIKNHGRGKQGGYTHYRIGYNNRMMDIVAAIGRVQLRRLPAVVEGRRKNASKYDKFLEEIEELTPQAERKGFKSAYHVYGPRLESANISRDDLVERLREFNIGSRTVYALPCHLQETYRRIHEWRWSKVVRFPDYSSMNFPISESVGRTHLEIPVQPGVTDENVEYIQKTIKKILSQT